MVDEASFDLLVMDDKIKMTLRRNGVDSISKFLRCDFVNIKRISKEKADSIIDLIDKMGLRWEKRGNCSKKVRGKGKVRD